MEYRADGLIKSNHVRATRRNAIGKLIFEGAIFLMVGCQYVIMSRTDRCVSTVDCMVTSYYNNHLNNGVSVFTNDENFLIAKNIFLR